MPLGDTPCYRDTTPSIRCAEVLDITTSALGGGNESAGEWGASLLGRSFTYFTLAPRKSLWLLPLLVVKGSGERCAEPP